MNTYAEKNFTLMNLIIAAVASLIAGFVLGFFTRPVLADSYNVTIEIQDKEITSYPDQKPFIDKVAGRTYVPIRFVAENLGAKVDWIEDTRTVSIVKPGTNDMGNDRRGFASLTRRPSGRRLALTYYKNYIR